MLKANFPYNHFKGISMMQMQALRSAEFPVSYCNVVPSCFNKWQKMNLKVSIFKQKWNQHHCHGFL